MKPFDSAGNRPSMRTTVDTLGPSGTVCVPKTLPSALYSLTCEVAAKLVELDQWISVVLCASNSTSVKANACPGSEGDVTARSEPASIQLAPRTADDGDPDRTQA